MAGTPQTATAQELRTDQALPIRRLFTTPGTHPFEAVEWELRDARIGHGDHVAFEQEDVEFPKSWSQNATNIVAQKYFRGQLDSPGRERSVKEMISRVAGTITGWGRAGGYFASEDDARAFNHELTHILLNQMAAFNSPVWFNVGFEESPQCSACFILSVDDTMESILDWNTKEGTIFRGGSGSGINLSNIRGSMEPLAKGGTASGPVSFMRGADSWAGTIKSGGKTRRAAKMVVLDIDHPDIREFIWCKAREEDKAAALRDAGFDMSIDGDGFFSIQYQNANNSVRITDEFMQAVEEDRDWRLHARTTGEPIGEPISARELMREIAEAAWRCADPGVQYDTTINRWHTSPNSGRINASNPCFPGDARVHTTQGLMPIAELVERGERGEAIRVYTHRATAEEPSEGVAATRPIAFMRNGVKPIVRLRFANGGELRCTPNHRIWTLNRGYVPAEDLTSEDRVLLNDSPTPAADSIWELPVRVHARAKSFARGGSVTYRELPKRWSEGLGELTGHLVGDGWVTDSQTGWTYGRDDIEDGLLDAHEGMLRELVGGISRQAMENGTVQLRAGSEAVRELFRGLGVTSVRAHQKRVPEAVFSAPCPVQAAFLRGLFGADGCVSRVEGGGKASRYVGLGSHSESLLKDVQRLLLTWGIRSRIYRISESGKSHFAYTRKDGHTVEYATREGFDLRVTGTDVAVFCDEIGFSCPRKQAALETPRGRAQAATAPSQAPRLLAREEDGQEQVYNLTEPLHHSYIVDGVVVANCSEYMHVDDSACNLASINLMKFRRPDGTLDVETFEHVVDIMLLAQEIVVGPSSYPTEEIAANARAFRQLGLGYANLGAYLMSDGMPYDSDRGRGTAAAITALMTGRAYRRSAEVAGALGPYDRYEENREPHNQVMRMHMQAAHAIPDDSCPDGSLLAAARRSWEEAVELGERQGYRNAQATVLAPTGTISFLMDCDTTGVEPDFSLVKFKELVGGGQMTIVNRTVPLALQTLGYTDPEIEQIEAHLSEHGTILGAPGLKEEHLPVFDVAVGERAISHMGHIKMMGAVQPFISGAISKTVNLPQEATVEDIADAYIQAWRGHQGSRDLPRRLQDRPGAAHRCPGQRPGPGRRGRDRPAGRQQGPGRGRPPAQPDAPRAPVDHPQVLHRRPRGLHHGRHVRGRVGGRDLPHRHRQGGIDPARDDERLRHRHLHRPAVRGAARDAGAEVQLHALRAGGHHRQPGDPLREVPARLHHALAGLALPRRGRPGGTRNPHSRGPGSQSRPGGRPGGREHPTRPAPRAARTGTAPRRRPAETAPSAPATAFTDSPPVVPARLQGLDLGPACSQCGGMMQRTGSCYTCSSCGNNTGCG